MTSSLQSLLEYHLFRVAEYSFTVYDLIKLIIFFMIGKVLLWAIRKVMKRKWKAEQFDIGSGFAIYQIIKYILWIIILVLALESVGIQVTILIAGSAALLVGIGLGLQQTFNDIISGVILLIEGSIKVGDVLEVDGEVVRVKRIGLRTSIVEDRSEIINILPNSKIVTDKVTNWSHNHVKTRFNISVGVAYGSNVDTVLKILAESAAAHPQVMEERAPFARLVNFGDSSLDFEVYFWSEHIFPVEQVKSDIRHAIVSRFRDEGIVIPFPQRDLHLKSANPGTSGQAGNV